MRILRIVGIWVMAGGLTLVSGTLARAQGNGRGGGSQSSTPSVSGPVPLVQSDDRLTSMQEDQAKQRNVDRQKQLVEDTEKLLSLANELKAEVDKSTKDTLSLDVIRKADEIEKLAHNVKEKMKCSGCGL